MRLQRQKAGIVTRDYQVEALPIEQPDQRLQPIGALAPVRGKTMDSVHIARSETGRVGGTPRGMDLQPRTAQGSHHRKEAARVFAENQYLTGSHVAGDCARG